MIRSVRLGAALLLLGCAAAGGRLPAPPGGSIAVEAELALAFQERAESFYRRLLLRRVNALETFNDPVLRQHFVSDDRFFDYYADLATALDEAHFERSQPTAIELEEFAFESGDAVWVQVRFTGRDDRPLRPDTTFLLRRDRWERGEAAWHLTPGKL